MEQYCEVCAHIKNCDKHRIVPGLRFGGKYTPENIIMVCRSCHSRIHRIIRQIKAKEKTQFLLAIEEARTVVGVEQKRNEEIEYEWEDVE